jgi:hypothetical protein
MIVMPAIWLVVVAAAYVRAGRASRLAAVVAVAGLTILGATMTAHEMEIETSYYAYAISVQQETAGRVWTSSWGDLWQTLAQAGVLGAGLGSASQGTQHIGSAPQRSWQEGGLSKLLVELGLPGLLCALALAAALARALARSLGFASAPGGRLLVGVIAFCTANAASFVVSHQVYGDLLVMTLTAFFTGVALAGRRWLVEA